MVKKTRNQGYLYIRQNNNIHIKTVPIGKNPPYFDIIAIKTKKNYNN